MAALSAFFDKRLLIVTGKGGVGKSSIAAAMALRCAGKGKKTLLVELNTPEQAAGLLGRSALNAHLNPAHLNLLEERLWAVNIRPQEALREYVLMTLKYPMLYRAVFENRVVRTFIRLLPSVQELVMLGKVFYHLRERDSQGAYRFDRIVLDAPATGHALSMLSVPQVLLDTVPPGPLAHEAKIMRDLLVDSSVTAVALVSLPEEMPVVETLELNEALQRRVKVQPSAVILNGFTAPRFDPEDVKRLAGTPTALALTRSHLLRARRSQEARRRLEEGTQQAICIVPQLFEQGWGRGAVEKIALALAPLANVEVVP